MDRQTRLKIILSRNFVGGHVQEGLSVECQSPACLVDVWATSEQV